MGNKQYRIISNTAFRAHTTNMPFSHFLLYEGYMDTAESLFTEDMPSFIKEPIHIKPQIMTAIFLTDYINGDTYYHMVRNTESQQDKLSGQS